MALQLNLLHEEFSEQRQRQRDPLKLGIIALCTFGAILFLYYGWNAYQTLQIKSELSEVEADWAKVEPKVTAAQNRAEELRKIIDSTKVLDSMIEGRFYWAPFLATLSHCVAPNLQLISLDGNVAESNKIATVVLEGISAAREPRAAAEEFRQLLSEQLSENSLGIRPQSGSPGQGVVVDQVTPASPAAESDVQSGDVLQKFDGQNIESFSQLLELVAVTELNRNVELDLVRNSKPVKTKLRIKQRHPGYTEVRVGFKNLEDLDTSVNLAGVPTPSARFVLNISFNPTPGATSSSAAAPEPAPTK